MENWVKSSGYPVLTVTKNGNQVEISQVNIVRSVMNNIVIIEKNVVI